MAGWLTAIVRIVVIALIRRVETAWWTPRWSFVAKMWRAWGELSRPLFVVRVELVSSVIGTLMVAALKIAFPFLQLAALWKLAVANVTQRMSQKTTEITRTVIDIF